MTHSLGSLELPAFKFNMTWQPADTELPPMIATRVVTHGVHLRVPFMPKSSFGHLMRDNYEPMVRCGHTGRIRGEALY